MGLTGLTGLMRLTWDPLLPLRASKASKAPRPPCRPRHPRRPHHPLPHRLPDIRADVTETTEAAWITETTYSPCRLLRVNMPFPPTPAVPTASGGVAGQHMGPSQAPGHRRPSGCSPFPGPVVTDFPNLAFR